MCSTLHGIAKIPNEVLTKFACVCVHNASLNLQLSLVEFNSGSVIVVVVSL